MSNPTSENPNLADNLLFEQFAMLATAPDGIGRLRDLILQLAVQGRLVRQEPGDEPASLLLERIRKEKEKLIKEGKVKREKSLEPINQDNISYTIPKEWQLTKFGDIIQRISNGYSGTQIKDISGTPVTRIETISHGYIDKTRLGYIQEASDDAVQYYRLEEGDILFSHINSDKHLGKTAIFQEPNLILHGTNLLLIRLFKNLISVEYIDLYLKNLRSIGYFISIAQHAIHQSSINQTKVKEIVLAIPPLAEQHRIVARVDRLMALCDELEARQQQERAGCLKLGTASFAGLQNAESPEEFGRQWAQVCDAFDLILDCPENVAVLRQTILQLAVQGRLVRQDPGDEPASVHSYNERKERKTKLIKPVNEEEIPFTIPKKWRWLRVGNLGTTRTGTTPSKSNPDFFGSYIPFVKPADITVNEINCNGEGLSKEGLIEGRLIPKNSIIMVCIGGSIGKTGLTERDISCNQQINAITPFEIFNPKYIIIAFRSIYFQTLVWEFAAMGSLPIINKSKWENIPIPLPPLAEQHRIVAKVDALMALCDQLEAQLKERAGMQGKFADAVVKSLGTG